MDFHEIQRVLWKQSISMELVKLALSTNSIISSKKNDKKVQLQMDKQLRTHLPKCGPFVIEKSFRSSTCAMRTLNWVVQKVIRDNAVNYFAGIELPTEFFHLLWILHQIESYGRKNK